MRRRKVLVTFGGVGSAAIAGCIGGIGGGSGSQGSCAAPSTDDLQSLFPSDTDTFTGQYGSSGGLHGIGTDEYFVGRYTGPNGDGNGLLIAKYSSQSDAESNLDAVLSEAGAPATGYVITGQYLILVDAQSRDLGRRLVRESELDNGCASQLTFTSQTGGTSTETATETEEPTETKTETETKTTTPEPVVASFSDGWEDGNARRDPIWEVSDGVTVVEESAPDGGNYSLQMVPNQNQRFASIANGVRWDAPWTVDGMFKIEAGDNGFLSGLAQNIQLVGTQAGIRTEGPNNNNKTVRAKLSDSALHDSTSKKTVPWEPDTWHRYKCRHDGNGTYKLKFWNVGNDEPDSYDRQASGSAPDSEKRSSLGYFAYSSSKQNVHHAYISYRTDAAADQ